MADTEDNIKYELIFDTLEGKGIYHLWFIPELLILYLLTPILREAFKKREICQYFLIIFFIAGMLFPSFLLYDFPYKRFVKSYYERTSLVMLTGYIGYYVAGHYIHTFISPLYSKKKKTIFIILTMISYLVTVLACSHDALNRNEPSSIMNTPLAASHFLTAISIFLLVKNSCKNLVINKHSRTHTFSKLCIGIYLIHPFVINILNNIGLSTIKPHPSFMIPLFVGITFLSSALLVYLLQRIPGIRKMVS